MNSKLSYTFILGGGFLVALLLGLIVFKFFFQTHAKEESSNVPAAQVTTEQPEKAPEQKDKEEKTSKKDSEKTEEKKDPTVVAKHDTSTANEKADTHEVITLPILKPKESPKLSLIITGLGLDNIITNRAITELPPTVGLAFSPYSKMLNRWIAPAKERGHLLFIELPTESDINMQGLLIYFDGLLLTHGKEPLKEKEKLTELVLQLKDKNKIIIDQRLLAENSFALEAKRQDFTSFYFVDYTLTADHVMRDKQDPLQKEGIVTVSAELVPYLIKALKKTSPKAPLKPVHEKDAPAQKS